MGIELLDELGSGSFSVLYLADDHSRHKKVAIKMEKPEKPRSILLTEYQCLLRLNGLPGIVPAYDFVSQQHFDKPNFIVMALKGLDMAKL